MTKKHLLFFLFAFLLIGCNKEAYEPEEETKTIKEGYALVNISVGNPEITVTTSKTAEVEESDDLLAIKVMEYVDGSDTETVDYAQILMETTSDIKVPGIVLKNDKRYKFEAMYIVDGKDLIYDRYGKYSYPFYTDFKIEVSEDWQYNPECFITWQKDFSISRWSEIKYFRGKHYRVSLDVAEVGASISLNLKPKHTTIKYVFENLKENEHIKLEIQRYLSENSYTDLINPFILEYDDFKYNPDTEKHEYDLTLSMNESYYDYGFNVNIWYYRDGIEMKYTEFKKQLGVGVINKFNIELIFGVEKYGGIIAYKNKSSNISMFDILPGDYIIVANEEPKLMFWGNEDMLMEYNRQDQSNGLFNCNEILKDNPILPEGCAVKYCIDYRGGGYDDWYLPGYNEFQIIWWHEESPNMQKFYNKTVWFSNSHEYRKQASTNAYVPPSHMISNNYCTLTDMNYVLAFRRHLTHFNYEFLKKYTNKELIMAGYSEKNLRAHGFTDEQLANLGFSIND